MLYTHRPKLLELTSVSENIIMDNLEVFKMNGFHFHIDQCGKHNNGILLECWLGAFPLLLHIIAPS